MATAELAGHIGRTDPRLLLTADPTGLAATPAAVELVAAADLRPPITVAVLQDAAGRLLMAPLVVTGTGLRRARPCDGAAVELLRLIADGGPVSAPFTVQRVGAVAEPSPVERSLDAERDDELVVVGDEVVIRWHAHPAAFAARPGEVAQHLVEVGFARMPQPYGALVWERSDGAAAAVGTAESFLPGARGGWDWYLLLAQGHLAGRVDPAAATVPAAELGRLLAHLHAALATPSSVLPEPVSAAGADAVAGWRHAAAELFAEAVVLTSGEQGERLRARKDAVRRVLSTLGEVERTPVMLVHGDLRLSHVLQWDGGYAVSGLNRPVSYGLDAGRPQPAARDVAALLRSMDHVGRVAARRSDPPAEDRLDTWLRWSRTAFLGAYLGELSAAGAREVFDDRLLLAFEVERECREFLYAARELPRWGHVAGGGLDFLLPEPG